MGDCCLHGKYSFICIWYKPNLYFSALAHLGTAANSTSSPAPGPSSFSSRSRPVAPLPYHHLRHHSASSGLLDEAGAALVDDGIVPSTPTLFAPRRHDGFGEAVSSPHVPSGGAGRFTFNESPLVAGVGAGGSGGVQGRREAVPEHRLEVPQADDDSRL